MIGTSSFQFGTKAENLIRLRSLIKEGKICESFVFTVEHWKKENKKIVQQIMEMFDKRHIIVRSSTLAEDTESSSMAGAFLSIPNVSTRSASAISDAVSCVIGSYFHSEMQNIAQCQILIQPMITNVIACGVIFTRDLEKLGPYYVINYDESERTDSITAGYIEQSKTLYINRNADLREVDQKIQNVIRAVKEIERLTDSNKLDIEFAITNDGEIYILQVRPLVSGKIMHYANLDAQIDREIEAMEGFIQERIGEQPYIYGDKTIYGQMPDWNPAEIIGSHPRPLALSLYRFLIMKDAWREGRSLLGYHNPAPHQLMVNIGNRAFVDVRNSFNSLIPANLKPELAHRLVSYYIYRLEAHPEFHDKIEFEIVISCLAFDFEIQEKRLRAANFTDDEIRSIKNALRILTDNIVLDKNGALRELESRVSDLATRRAKINQSQIKVSSIPNIVEMILEDCIYFGTIPFSAYARGAFIGTSLLRTLKERNFLSEEQFDQFLHSIDTVASEFVSYLGDLNRETISLEDFLGKFGHLRPGTYDITTYRYDENPELYLSIKKHQQEAADHREKAFYITLEQEEIINTLLKNEGFQFTSSEMFDFMRKCIQKREYIKFEFTKSLSLAMQLIIEYGEYHGISREDLAYLEIEDILYFSNQYTPSSLIQQLKQNIDARKKRYQLTSFIHLPDLIFSKADLKVIRVQQYMPNFITQGKVTAPVLCLDEKVHISEDDLDGKIVFIESADPGYDWIFSKNIVGLVTRYGGVASHMAIRCAEFGLPAAIGCGKRIYQSLKIVEKVMLNCAEKKIEACGIRL